MCGAPCPRRENPCASLEAFDRREMDVELASFEVAAGRCEVARAAAASWESWVERRRQDTRIYLIIKRRGSVCASCDRDTSPGSILDRQSPSTSCSPEFRTPQPTTAQRGARVMPCRSREAHTRPVRCASSRPLPPGPSIAHKLRQPCVSHPQSRKSSRREGGRQCAASALRRVVGTSH